MGGVVLLTGATGFLGAQVARRLVSLTDHEVVALVRARTGGRPAAGWPVPGGTGPSWPPGSPAGGSWPWPATCGRPGWAWTRPTGAG
jgi:hypothetical protein